MTIIHVFNDHDSLDFSMVKDNVISQAVGRSDRILHHESTQEAKEIIMRAHGHASVWRIHIGVGRANEDTGWHQQLREWWAAHKAARREVNLTSLQACWARRREVVTPRRADAALEMAAAQHALSVATMLYGLSQ
jgi:hypothetical protein